MRDPRRPVGVLVLNQVSDPISESEGKDVREWIELRTVEVDEKEREDGKFPL